jgi:hypothetical protein
MEGSGQAQPAAERRSVYVRKKPRTAAASLQHPHFLTQIMNTKKKTQLGIQIRASRNPKDYLSYAFQDVNIWYALGSCARRKDPMQPKIILFDVQLSSLSFHAASALDSLFTVWHFFTLCVVGADGRQEHVHIGSPLFLLTWLS